MGTVKEIKSDMASVTVKTEPGSGVATATLTTTTSKTEIKTDNENRIYSSTCTKGKVKLSQIYDENYNCK